MIGNYLLLEVNQAIFALIHFYKRQSYGFRADENKSTTNVAWLVGAASGSVTVDTTPRHIDITTQDSVTPPAHLAVAPLNDKNNNKNTNSVNNIKMGYSLCRSKTVSDIHCWNGDNSDQGDSCDRPLGLGDKDQGKVPRRPGVRRNASSVSICQDKSISGSRYDMSAAGTISTQGSLRSRIVRHKTLLGSSSRLYKFSQSLSSLTTITSESRPASAVSTLSRDPNIFEPITQGEKLDSFSCC